MCPLFPPRFSLYQDEIKESELSARTLAIKRRGGGGAVLQQTRFLRPTLAKLKKLQNWVTQVEEHKGLAREGTRRAFSLSLLALSLRWRSCDARRIASALVKPRRAASDILSRVSHFAVFSPRSGASSLSLLPLPCYPPRALAFSRLRHSFHRPLCAFCTAVRRNLSRDQR